MDMASPTDFILRSEQIPRLGEFVKSKTRQLDHHIVDRGFKRGWRFARNIIRNFVQGVAHGQLCGNFGNRKSGRFTRQCRGTGHARVHFNNDQPTGLRCGRRTGYWDPPVSTPISRIMRNAASRMSWYSLSVRVWAGATVMESPVVNAERIEIFDGADDDHIVLGVTHHFQFKLFPTGNRLFNQDLMRGRGL